MRALIYFPIIYSHKDLGTLAKAASDLRTDEQEKKYLDATVHFQEMTITTIEGLGLNYQHLKLYQDGLPVCEKKQLTILQSLQVVKVLDYCRNYIERVLFL